MRKATVDIINDLFTQYLSELSGKITEIEEVETGIWIITVCKPLFLRPNSIITQGENTFEVVTVVGNDITVKGINEPIIDSFLFPKVYYFHGTPIMVGNELDLILNSTDKFPMLYLFERTRDNMKNTRFSSIDRISKLRMFFLDESNFEDWTTDDHYKEAVYPMFLLGNDFMEWLSVHPEVGTFEDWDIEYLPNFTIVYNEQGGQKKVINDDTSGIEIVASIPFETSICNCNNLC